MVKLIGPIRRSSLLGPYGVGAIVPFPYDETMMIAGLDKWNYRKADEFIIHEERLEKLLKVDQLRWPPDYKDQTSGSENIGCTIQAVRFPTWYYCPYCGQMDKATYYSPRPQCKAKQWDTGRSCKPGSKTRMIPERFIVVCPEGHIDDFPVAEWVHYGSVYPYENNGKHIIRRHTGGASAGLSGVIYECTCGAKRSMVGAFNNNALENIGYKCRGTMPWLGIPENLEQTCKTNNSKPVSIEGERKPDKPRVVLRGATNAWFGDVISSIFIPSDESPEQKKINEIIKQYSKLWLDQSFDNEAAIEMLLQLVSSKENVDYELLKQSVKNYSLPSKDDTEKEYDEDTFRLSEYYALIREEYGSWDEDFYSKNQLIEKYNWRIQPYFKSISLVKRLKETRVLYGFSRLTRNNAPISQKKKMLRNGTGNWLPAIETFGEGIFFEFNDDLLKKWADNPKVKQRIAKLNNSYQQSYLNKKKTGQPLKPEYVLIHTFAHLLINQLSYDCGYGSSSLRERLYCEKTDTGIHMNGVLIYTASGDSDGSMGGLVRQGEPGRLEDTIIKAIVNAGWCSSDPVCIQSHGQGPDSMNLAACHNCALLPETSCEIGNRLLDRGVVVGTLDDKKIGYFSDLNEE